MMIPTLARWLWRSSSLPVWLFALAAAAHAAQEKPVGTPPAGSLIEVFVREGCPHCDKAKTFLAQLQKEQPDLRIEIHDVQQDPAALDRLLALLQAHRVGAVVVPVIHVSGQLLVGFSYESGSDGLLRRALTQTATATSQAAPGPPPQSQFSFSAFGRAWTLDDLGLPAFTLALGLLDGFNPCSMWALLLMISLLAPMNDRKRMVIVAGTFVAVQGIFYFLFMAAWLNLFLFIGASRVSQLAVAAIAIIAGLINTKDFFAFGRGVSLSIPAAAKPGLYERMRRVLQAPTLTMAVLGTVVLAALVQVVEFMCTSGFPALFTRILTLRELGAAAYYGYLLLYNAAYMLDDAIVLAIGVVMLSRARLQEEQGRWLKLVAGVVMIGLGMYLIVDG